MAYNGGGHGRISTTKRGHRLAKFGNHGSTMLQNLLELWKHYERETKQTKND